MSERFVVECTEPDKPWKRALFADGLQMDKEAAERTAMKMARAGFPSTVLPAPSLPDGAS